MPLLGERETNSNFLPCKHAPSLFADGNLDASILSLMRDMDTNRGGGVDGGKTRNAAESFVRADYRSIFEQVHSTSLSLSLWKSFFTRLPRQSFPRYVPHFSPVKIHFPEHDTFEDAARAAHYPLPALHPSLTLSLYALSIRFEIVKFHRFTNYRSRSPLLHSKVVSVSIRVSLIFFLRSFLRCTFGALIRSRERVLRGGRFERSNRKIGKRELLELWIICRVDTSNLSLLGTKSMDLEDGRGEARHVCTKCNPLDENLNCSCNSTSKLRSIFL